MGGMFWNTVLLPLQAGGCAKFCMTDILMFVQLELKERHYGVTIHWLRTCAVYVCTVISELKSMGYTRQTLYPYITSQANAVNCIASVPNGHEYGHK